VKLLVVGGGYIGTAFARHTGADIVDSFEGYKHADYARYTTVLFAAGIAHVSEKKTNPFLYYSVNRDLAVDVARRAKAAGVRQYIYLSSMAVYGVQAGAVHPDDAPQPKGAYATSKFEAEQQLAQMQTDSFRVLCVRPPMVYGAGCPGKYRTLSKLARFMPLAPCNNNRRSVLHIHNLCIALANAAEAGTYGILCPHDPADTSTADMIVALRDGRGKRTKKIRCAVLIKLAGYILPQVRIAWGTLYYKV
jgi:UDP-glucose 4-epimerase